MKPKSVSAKEVEDVWSDYYSLRLLEGTLTEEISKSDGKEISKVVHQLYTESRRVAVTFLDYNELGQPWLQKLPTFLSKNFWGVWTTIHIVVLYGVWVMACDMTQPREEKRQRRPIHAIYTASWRDGILQAGVAVATLSLMYLGWRGWGSSFRATIRIGVILLILVAILSGILDTLMWLWGLTAAIVGGEYSLSLAQTFSEGTVTASQWAQSGSAWGKRLLECGRSFIQEELKQRWSGKKTTQVTTLKPTTAAPVRQLLNLLQKIAAGASNESQPPPSEDSQLSKIIKPVFSPILRLLVTLKNRMSLVELAGLMLYSWMLIPVLVYYVMSRLTKHVLLRPAPKSDKHLDAADVSSENILQVAVVPVYHIWLHQLKTSFASKVLQKAEPTPIRRRLADWASHTARRLERRADLKMFDSKARETKCVQDADLIEFTLRHHGCLKGVAHRVHTRGFRVSDLRTRVGTEVLSIRERTDVQVLKGPRNVQHAVTRLCAFGNDGKTGGEVVGYGASRPQIETLSPESHSPPPLLLFGDSKWAPYQTVVLAQALKEHGYQGTPIVVEKLGQIPENLPIFNMLCVGDGVSRAAQHCMSNGMESLKALFLLEPRFSIISSTSKVRGAHAAAIHPFVIKSTLKAFMSHGVVHVLASDPETLSVSWLGANSIHFGATETNAAVDPITFGQIFLASSTH